jgi:hypothetical protein
MWFATFFKGTEGVLDGHLFKLNKDHTAYAINLSILLPSAIIIGIIAWFKQRLVNQFFVFISGMFALFVIWVIVTGQKPPSLTSDMVQKEAVTFSKEKNVLVILLDTFQSDFFQTMLQQSPVLAYRLRGFTYYPNAAGVAPTTYLSVPSIHSGEVYSGKESVSSFYQRTVLQHSFVELHAKEHYRGFILNPYMDFCPPHTLCGKQGDIYSSLEEKYAERTLLLNISLLRSLPHLLKRHVYQHGNWLFGKGIPTNETLSNAALSFIANHMNTDAKAPTIKFLHLLNSHPPAILNAACKQYKRAKYWSFESAVELDTCAFSNAITLLQALKDANIYDQTAIIILGDHGASLPKGDEDVIHAAANPLFLYKPFQKKGSLKTSPELVSIIDIGATLCAMTHDCSETPRNGRDIFKVASPRLPYQFNFYEWHTDYITKRGVFPIVRYEIKGPPRHNSSWHEID